MAVTRTSSKRKALSSASQSEGDVALATVASTRDASERDGSDSHPSVHQKSDDEWQPGSGDEDSEATSGGGVEMRDEDKGEKTLPTVSVVLPTVDVEMAESVPPPQPENNPTPTENHPPQQLINKSNEEASGESVEGNESDPAASEAQPTQSTTPPPSTRRGVGTLDLNERRAILREAKCRLVWTRTHELVDLKTKLGEMSRLLDEVQRSVDNNLEAVEEITRLYMDDVLEVQYQQPFSHFFRDLIAYFTRV
jgi:hypothetical protein